MNHYDEIDHDEIADQQRQIEDERAAEQAGPEPYPRRDEHHPATYWTGELNAPGTFVTGRRSWGGGGNSTTYWEATCTCTPYGAVGPTRYGAGALDRVESDAYEHAASHVLRPSATTTEQLVNEIIDAYYDSMKLIANLGYAFGVLASGLTEDELRAALARIREVGQ